jgi:hypothetical protein
VSDRSMLRAIPILTAFSVSVMGKPMTVTGANGDLCQDEWQHTLQSPADAESKICEWSALQKKCPGGLYEARLGTLYIFAGRYDDARAAAKAGLVLGTAYEKGSLRRGG